MYDRETRTWNIDPTEYDVEADVTTFYVPTLEKDANIKAWLIARYNENRNKKLDQVFMRFAPWMAQKISKDDTIAKRQMRELEMKYKSWDEGLEGTAYTLIAYSKALKKKVRLVIWIMGAPDKPCGVGRADANPKLLLNDT